MIGPMKMHNSTNFFCAIRLSFPRTFSSELMIFSHIIIENYFYHIFKYFMTSALTHLSYCLSLSISDWICFLLLCLV